jgi:putative endonuclease
VTARLLQYALDCLDRLARRLPWARQNAGPQHLRTGRRGEDEAYFWLRRQGYTMVARNWRCVRHRGEIDLIGWDGCVLCFIEVKTRSHRDFVPAEAAVDRAKQQSLRAVARDYQRRLPRIASCRFDVVSVYFEPDRPAEIELIRNAFPISAGPARSDYR